MISNIIFVSVILTLLFIGYKSYSDGERTPFFYTAIKVLGIIQICLMALVIIDFSYTPYHRTYTETLDWMYRAVLFVCSLALWGIPATGYFLSQMVEKTKLAFQDED